MKKNNLWLSGFAFLMTAVLAGCVSVPDSPSPRFYTLRAQANDQGDWKVSAGQKLIIGFGPVNIPEYQNRPQIVTQDKNGMLNFAQFDRWGESLDVAIQRTISEDLVALLPGVGVQPFPWNISVPVKYQVIVEITQLESDLDKEMRFAAQWSIIDHEFKKLLVIKRSELRQPIIPHTYAGLAQTLSVQCNQLSNEIAAEIVRLASPDKKPGPQ